MKALLITILYLVPPSLGIVDCITACKHCQDQDEKHPKILEVYCAMCQECKDQQKERRLRTPRRQALLYNPECFPECCPPPPPCDTDAEELVHPLAESETPTTTTQTTTTQTAATQSTTTTTCHPCPPPPYKRRPVPCLYPCMPMCPCPYPYPYPPYPPPTNPAYPPPTNPAYKQTVTTSSGSTGDLYVYVGVPRELLNKKNKK